MTAQTFTHSDLVKRIVEIFDEVTKNLPPQVKTAVETTVMGPVLDEARVITESRPPRIMLVGRAGSGKSSMINALAGKHVAEPSDIDPGVPSIEPYTIPFSDGKFVWQVRDTRGILHNLQDNSLEKDAEEVLREELRSFRPDVLLHVMDGSNRGYVHEFNAIAQLQQDLGVAIPTVIAMNMMDRANPTELWPPEEQALKAGQIEKAMVGLIKALGVEHWEMRDPHLPLKGLRIDHHGYLAVIPTATQDDQFGRKVWNIPTLMEFIGDQLPTDAKYLFFRAQQNSDVLRKIAQAVTARFALVAGGIGAIPAPPLIGSGILLGVLVTQAAIIGALSGRDPNWKTGAELFAAGGVGFGILMTGRFLIEAAGDMLPIPVVGQAIAAAAATSAAYVVGKAAEEYYFDNTKPTNLLKQVSEAMQAS